MCSLFGCTCKRVFNKAIEHLLHRKIKLWMTRVLLSFRHMYIIYIICILYTYYHVNTKKMLYFLSMYIEFVRPKSRIRCAAIDLIKSPRVFCTNSLLMCERVVTFNLSHDFLLSFSVGNCLKLRFYSVLKWFRWHSAEIYINNWNNSIQLVLLSFCLIPLYPAEWTINKFSLQLTELQ